MDLMSQGGGGDSIDTCSDISDLGKALNYDNISTDFSQISDAMCSGIGGGALGAANTHFGGQDFEQFESKSLSSLRIFLDQPDSNFSQHNIPNMDLQNFMALWTSLSEIVGQSNNDIQQACMKLHQIKLIFY